MKALSFHYLKSFIRNFNPRFFNSLQIKSQLEFEEVLRDVIIQSDITDVPPNSII